MLMYGREAQSKTRIASPATIPKSGEPVSYTHLGSSIYMDAFSKNGSVVFQIENTGVHIPEAEIPKLFDAFYRMEQSRNRKTGGSGLGLYIVKTILEQHNIIYSLKNTDRGVLFSIRF